MKGKYIYGIIDGNVELRFSTRGLFNQRPYLINYNNLFAIVTDVPMKTYEGDPELLLSHNRVLDEVIKIYSVLPMRFGIIARSEDEVKGLLQNASNVLKDRLSKIKDMVEFNLTVFISNEKSIINEILKKNKEIQDLRDKLIPQGKDVRIEDKLSIGKMIAGEVSKYKISLIKAIDIALKPYYLQCKSLTQKDILVNSAYLVMREKIKEFESQIYKLGERYGDRLKFKYAGPLVPYSFVEMNLILINFEKVDKARKQLNLGEKATFSDIKEAYRRLAREYHPDKGHGDSLKEEEFKKIASSYRLLYEYCRRYPKDIYVFKPDKIDEFSVIVG